MKIDASLKEAITALDLSSWEARYGATALAIVLLEDIWSAEAKVPGKLERYFSRLECGHNEITEFDDDLREINYAISMLYRTYGLRQFKRLGSVSIYLNKIGACAEDTADYHINATTTLADTHD